MNLLKKKTEKKLRTIIYSSISRLSALSLPPYLERNNITMGIKCRIYNYFPSSFYNLPFLLNFGDLGR